MIRVRWGPGPAGTAATAWVRPARKKYQLTHPMAASPVTVTTSSAPVIG
jgi:hypothetical protein